MYQFRILKYSPKKPVLDWFYQLRPRPVQDCKRPIKTGLGWSSPVFLGSRTKVNWSRSWSCIFGPKDRTRPDLQTLNRTTKWRENGVFPNVYGHWQLWQVTLEIPNMPWDNLWQPYVSRQAFQTQKLPCALDRVWAWRWYLDFWMLPQRQPSFWLVWCCILFFHCPSILVCFFFYSFFFYTNDYFIQTTTLWVPQCTAITKTRMTMDDDGHASGAWYQWYVYFFIFFSFLLFTAKYNAGTMMTTTTHSHPQNDEQQWAWGVIGAWYVLFFLLSFFSFINKYLQLSTMPVPPPEATKCCNDDNDDGDSKEGPGMFYFFFFLFFLLLTSIYS